MSRKKAQQPAILSEQFENEWRNLQSAFKKLLDFVESGYKKPPELDPWIKQNMAAYACVYNLCTRNEGSKSGGINSAQILYTRAKTMTENYLDESVTKQVTGKKGEELLSNVYTAWDHHQLVVRWGRFMFRYLDDYYTKQQNIEPLRIMMLQCFHTAVFEKIKHDLCEVLLNEVRKEREGIDINRTVMKEAIGLFVEMGMDQDIIYKTDFESFFLARTAEYYKRTAVQWLNEPGGNFTYLHRVERSLNEEHTRARNYLHSSSLVPVVSCVENELLVNYQMQVLEDPDAGTIALLSNHKTEDLGRMYSLFKRTPRGLEPMANIMRDYIKQEGKEINKKFCNGELDSNQYIDQCLELHDKYSELFRNFFEDNGIFLKARKEAYEVFINETLQHCKGETNGQKVTTSELLSAYCDNLMKNEKITPDQLDEKLDKIVCLFTYISDKDLFQEFYRKQMSRRLLVTKCDHDNERQLISKLKLKMGAPYTSKLEGMIVDKGISGDTQKNFMEFCRNHKMEMKIDFTVQILTTGFWPAFKIDVMNIPDVLKTHLDMFKLFYDKTTQSRVLKWVHSLGTATIHSRFKKGQKEIMASTFQACVLLFYNEKNEMSIGDLGRELALPTDEVKRTIQSLAFGKFPVLKRKNDDKKKTVSDEDVFVVNEDFNCPQRKFKIPNIIKNVGDPVEKTDENRRHVVEACIVRIMKSRKEMAHLELQTECIRHLSTYFKPDPKIIKKRIEDLIQRSYLERDETDRSIYRYLA